MQPRAGRRTQQPEGGGGGVSRPDLGRPGRACCGGRHREAAAADPTMEGRVPSPGTREAALEGAGAVLEGSRLMEGWGKGSGAGEGNESAPSPPSLGAVRIPRPIL